MRLLPVKVCSIEFWHRPFLYRSSEILLFLFLAWSNILFAQVDTTGLVRYTPEFRFTDGFYINFSQVRTNHPVLKSRILTTVDYNDESFFKQILDEKKISFYDESGAKQEFQTSKIWGFAKNGNLYIRVGNEFNRIIVVGSICHFIADVSTYNPSYYNPYIYDYYSYPYSYPYYNSSAYETKEMKQFLLDFNTGKIYDYEVKSVEILLMKDTSLYEEYMNLSNKKKKQLKFMYVRRFNERNPLYLPPSR